MDLPQNVLDHLSANNFHHTYTNEYSGTDRFVRKTRNIPVKRRIYQNCAVVVETYAENFISMNIFGYAPKTGFVHNITRDVFPGTYQFIYTEDFGNVISILDQKAVGWRRQFTL